MTSDGKLLSSLLRGFFRFSAHLILLLSLQSLMSGCKSTSGTQLGRTLEQKKEIQTLVTAGKLVECKLINHEWFIPGDVQQAQIIRNKGQLALIYQAMLRSGPRTVYQSLSPSFAFQGDGFVVGVKSSPNVSDFRTYDDSAGNMWTVSRIKSSETELTKGLVEVNIKDKTFRTILPTPANETVQQIWPTLPAGNGVSNVVVRTTPVEDSSSTDSADESTFYWFQVGSNDNSARNLGSFRSSKTRLQPAAFIALERTAEPIAISIVQPQGDEESLESRPSNTPTRVSLNRIFTRNPQERVIFSGKGNIMALNAAGPNDSGLHLAWLFSPQKSSSKFIQTTTLNTKFIPERFFGKSLIREQENILVTEISYEGNDPEFLFTKNQNQTIPVLGWWGKLESEVAVLLQPILPNFRNGRTTAVKAPDGSALGMSFSPALAVIPPRTFNRVMSFSAAPSASEKNIMVLSNRSESAELQKETILYPCTF